MNDSSQGIKLKIIAQSPKEVSGSLSHLNLDKLFHHLFSCDTPSESIFGLMFWACTLECKKTFGDFSSTNSCRQRRDPLGTEYPPVY